MSDRRGKTLPYNVRYSTRDAQLTDRVGLNARARSGVLSRTHYKSGFHCAGRPQQFALPPLRRPQPASLSRSLSPLAARASSNAREKQLIDNNKTTWPRPRALIGSKLWPTYSHWLASSCVSLVHHCTQVGTPTDSFQRIQTYERTLLSRSLSLPLGPPILRQLRGFVWVWRGVHNEK